jgi:hypothetical protein
MAEGRFLGLLIRWVIFVTNAYAYAILILCQTASTFYYHPFEVLVLDAFFPERL